MWFAVLLLAVYFGAIFFPIIRKIVGALSLRRHIGKVAREAQKRHELAEARPPQPRYQTITITVGGKEYGLYCGGFTGIEDFTAEQLDLPDAEHLQFRAFRDIHGREVLYSRSLFPCFDEFDRETENRHYHYFLVFHEEGVTAVRASDDSTSVTVTDHVTRKDAAKRLDLRFNGDEHLQKTAYWERLPE